MSLILATGTTVSHPGRTRFGGRPTRAQNTAPAAVSQGFFRDFSSPRFGVPVYTEVERAVRVNPGLSAIARPTSTESLPGVAARLGGSRVPHSRMHLSRVFSSPPTG